MKKKLVLTVSIVVLAVMIAVMCVACTPSSDSVKKKLEKNDCTVMVIEAPSGAEYEGVEKVLSAKSKKDDGALMITWFKSEKDAKEAYSEAKEMMDELEELGDGDYVIKRKGKALIAGSKALAKLV